MDPWLTKARDAVAEAAGVAPEELELDDGTVRTLLAAARVAAHESGERTNAPLLCFLLGRASAGAPLDELVAALRSR